MIKILYEEKVLTAMTPKKICNVPEMTIDKTKEVSTALETAKGNIVLERLCPSAIRTIVNTSSFYFERFLWRTAACVFGFKAQGGDPAQYGFRRRLFISDGLPTTLMAPALYRWQMPGLIPTVRNFLLPMPLSLISTDIIPFSVR